MSPALEVTVGEVLLRIETGKSVKTQERPASQGELGILRVSAVTWGEFRPEENKAVLPDHDPGDCPRPGNGDILISRANTRELVGAPVIVSGDHPNLLLSDKILRLVPDETRVDRRYLMRALRSQSARLHFEKRAGGTSGSMTNITQEDIRATPLPLPSLPEQRRIADILDKADAIRRKRKEAIALTEQLLRSTFLEMFGDPVTNPKGWPVKPLGELADVNRGKFSPRPRNDPRFYGGRYPFIQTGELRNTTGYLRSWRQTLNDEGTSVSRSFQRGTIAIAIAANIGDTAIVDFDFYCPDSVVGIAAKQTLATNEYLEMTLRFFQSKLINEAPETAQKNINLETLRPLPVPTPRLASQQRFSAAYRATYNTILHMEASARNYHELFSSLIHRAFSGTL